MLRIAASRGFLELTQNVIRLSHGHSIPSLKISYKSVRPFFRNLAEKETKKETNKQIDQKQYPMYWGRGNNGYAARMFSDNTKDWLRGSDPMRHMTLSHHGLAILSLHSTGYHWLWLELTVPSELDPLSCWMHPGTPATDSLHTHTVTWQFRLMITAYTPTHRLHWLLHSTNQSTDKSINLINQWMNEWVIQSMN